ncbi:hypothetical protein EDC01DRAFT_634544 [Geopyxis carbonaria]|nr:hypothetical protein EDC01DRAFT_634544 [Geopyxis carbonaria]
MSSLLPVPSQTPFNSILDIPNILYPARNPDSTLTLHHTIPPSSAADLIHTIPHHTSHFRPGPPHPDDTIWKVDSLHALLSLRSIFSVAAREPSTDATVGYAIWTTDLRVEEPPCPFPPGLDYPAWAATQDAINEVCERVAGLEMIGTRKRKAEESWRLRVVAGEGVEEMVRWGCKVTDAAGVGCCAVVEEDMMGPLERCGFKMMAGMEVADGGWLICMVRSPVGRGTDVDVQMG